MPRDVDEFLGQVRRAYTPDLEAKARVRRSLATAALLSSATVVSQTAAAKALGVKAGALGLGLTLAGVASVAVLVGAYAFADWSLPSGGSPVRLREPELPKVAETVAVRSAVSTQEHVLLPSPFSFEVPAVERTAEMHPAGHGTGTPVAASKEPPSRELIEELRLIRMATQSLRDGQTSAASQALDEHHSRYPNGKLATERRGLHVLLQCAAKTPGAQSAAEAFLKSSPSSPLSGRVRRDCFE